jgi:hypothetical protein
MSCVSVSISASLDPRRLLPVGAKGLLRNLIRVLEATLKAPVGWLPVPGWFTTSKITDDTASTGSNHPNFHLGEGVTAGDPMGWFVRNGWEDWYMRESDALEARHDFMLAVRDVLRSAPMAESQVRRFRLRRIRR